jgi:hypothetical protein
LIKTPGAAENPRLLLLPKNFLEVLRGAFPELLFEGGGIKEVNRPAMGAGMTFATAVNERVIGLKAFLANKGTDDRQVPGWHHMGIVTVNLPLSMTQRD